MSLSDPSPASKRVFIVGLGGLGCPAAIALARAGVGELVLCDDDRVDVTNLHRQILFTDNDVGRDKLDAAKDALASYGTAQVTLHRERLLPENALETVRGMDLVLEGSDNFATKFLTADACFLAGVPVVHGAAVRFLGTALSIGPKGGPCYRCLFEDLLPGDAVPNCAEAGVMGPVVGLVGALMADLALDVLTGATDRVGQVFSIDGKRLNVRKTLLKARSTCALCGQTEQETRIHDVIRSRYTSTRTPQTPTSCAP